jgi:copper transport protein
MNGRGRAWRTRLGAVMVGSAAMLLTFPSPVSAHTTLDRSDPPDGGTVTVGRSALTLWFSESISSDASEFVVHSVDGIRVATTATISESDGRGFVEIATGPLWQTTFVLDWAVLSLDDGHRSSGSVVFGAGVVPAVTSTGGERLPDRWSLLVRWADLAAIMTAIGALVAAGGVLRPLGAAYRRPLLRAQMIALGAASLAVVTSALTPLLRVPRFGRSLSVWLNATTDTMTGTTWGQLWLTREVLLVVLTVALVIGIGSRESTLPRSRVVTSDRIAALALIGVVGVESWTGHASALHRQPVVAAVASGAHLLAAGIWAGGLAVLAVCVVPVLRTDPTARWAAAMRAFTRFSPIAAISAAVLVASGLYESGRHLTGPGAVGSTAYGSAVAVKVALVVVALLVAGCNTLLVNPRPAAIVARRLGRPADWTPVARRYVKHLVYGEVAVLAIAVAAAAVVTSVATSRELEVAAAAETAPGIADVDGLFVTFEAVPAGADQSRLIVRARSTVKPEPAPIDGVAVHLVGADGSGEDVSLTAVEPGRYEAETAKLDPGPWRVEVDVHRGDLTDTVAAVDWSVPAPDRDAVRPFEAAMSTLAALVLALAIGTLLMLRRRPGTVTYPTHLLEHSR